MRLVKYIDDKGYIRTSLIKDEDPDSHAKQYGVPVEIPDLENGLDWDGLKRDLHNALIEAGFYTIQDVYKARNVYSPATTVLKRYLNDLYLLEASVNTQDNSSGG